MRLAISTPHGSKSFPLSAIALLSLLVCVPLSPLGEGVGERGVRAANPPPHSLIHIS
jgi:hypothetical protein